MQNDLKILPTVGAVGTAQTKTGPPVTLTCFTQRCKERQNQGLYSWLLWKASYNTEEIKRRIHAKEEKNIFCYIISLLLYFFLLFWKSRIKIILSKKKVKSIFLFLMILLRINDIQGTQYSDCIFIFKVYWFVSSKIITDLDIPCFLII